MSKNIAILLTDLNSGEAGRAAGLLSKELTKKYQVYLFLCNTENIGCEYGGVVVDIGGSAPFYEYSIKRCKEKYHIDVAISFFGIMNCANIRTRGRERVIIFERDAGSALALSKAAEILKIKRYYNYADEIVVSEKGIKNALEESYGVRNRIITICENLDRRLLFRKWMEVIESEGKKDHDVLADEMKLLESAKHIVIYGCGFVGKSCYLRLKDQYKVECFAVSSMTDNVSNLYGVPVYEIGSLKKKAAEITIIIGVGHEYQDDVVGMLQKEGFCCIVYPDIKPLSVEYYMNTQNLNIKKELLDWLKFYVEEEMDVDHPQTYNEKINWLKLYDSTLLKSRLADKVTVRDYVCERIGDEYLIPLFGVWNSFDEINFEELPSKFVLKCNHGSGMGVLVYDKKDLNYSEIKKQFDTWMQTKYEYVTGFEMHYADIVPKILAEFMLETDDGSDLKDYKVFVFNGKAKLIQVDIGRHHEHWRNLYTTDWEYLPYTILYPTAPEIVVERPECLEKLIDLAEKLGHGFIHVRVDFYILKDKIYFGEMTFTHGSGTEPFIPKDFGYEMGSWMDLNG